VARPISLRIPDEVRSAIERAASESARDFSSIANEMLTEAVKMRRIPGIYFANEAAGRRAKVAGTGIDVWQIIQEYQVLGRSMDRLRVAFHWLSDYQLRVALAYYDAYPQEIDRWIAESESLTIEHIWDSYPFTKPSLR
jgi:uncharacterized protein (DUF433 family)